MLESDSLLDEYFESLNAAFDSVGPAPSPATLVDTAPPVVDASRRRGDSLDDYVDRLSNAFEQAKPADAPHTLPDNFEEFIEERRVPTVDALVGAPKPLETLHGNGNGHGSANGLNGHARNPIVDALEAMLGVPEPMLSQPTLPGLPEPEVHANGNGAPVNGANGDLADAVTERVLDRLLPEITATVQRLVREEVDRLRQH